MGPVSSKLASVCTLSLFIGTIGSLSLIMSAEGTIIIGRDGVGTITCNSPNKSAQAFLSFTSIGKKGDLGFDGSYNMDSNSSIKSNGGIINVNSVNRTSNLYNLTYHGTAESCPQSTSFNSTITGSCGENAAVKFISKVITGEFLANVTCME